MLRLSVAQYPTFAVSAGGKEPPERHVRRLSLQPLRFRQNVAQSSAMTNPPQQQQDSTGKQKGRGVAAEDLDSLDSSRDDRDLDQPEQRERQSHAPSHGSPARPRGNEERVKRESTDPSLNAEPPARDDRAEHRGNVCPANSEARSAHHGEGDTVLGSGMRVQNHRDEHDDVAEEDRHQRLPPGHAFLHQSGRKRVCRDDHTHADPQRRNVVGGPRAPGEWRGREILVPERTMLDVVRNGDRLGRVRHARGRCDHDARPAVLRGSHLPRPSLPTTW